MAPMKNNKIKKPAASTPDKDKSKHEKLSYSRLSLNDSGGNFDQDRFPLDIEPSKEFSSLAQSISKNASPTCSPGGRKRSFRKLSLENSPQIPLNDDCTELIQEKEKSELLQEKSLNKSIAKVTADEEQELSIIQTMSMEQIQEHISRCLQLSTENKINVKNAFALKLIDCMTIISKNDDENNFAAMACQLDAGAKIYSHRVDAVHQEVMKLFETCTLAEKRGKKKRQEDAEMDEGNSDNEGNEGTSSDKVKGKKRKSKKKMIATFDQISRKPKENDPRETLVKLEALPGDILQKAKRNPKDLSLTLDKHIPFWMDWLNYSPTKADGESEIPHIVIKSRKLGPLLEMNHDVDLSCIPKFEPLLTSKQDDNDWYDDLMDDCDNSNEKVCETSSSTGSNIITEVKDSDVEVISLAKMKMSMNSLSEPSRLDVIKALFHRPGESDYHYLKMDNSYFWAGPSYWKRPQGINHAANKKRIVRKKKEALEIGYTEEAMKKSMKTKPSVTGIAVKRSTTLSKRSLAKWSKKKVTYPLDIFFKPQLFNITFHINIVAQVVLTNTISDHDPPVDEPQAETNEEEENADSSDSENVQDDDDTPEGDPVLETENDPESHGEDENAGSSTAGLSSGPTDMPIAESDTPGTDVAGPSEASSCDDYEGENLVPMVKRVQVNPIRCVPKPNRVDMQHLKDVMLVVVKQAIAREEERMRGEGIENPHAIVAFKDILTDLFSSDLLHYRTREDLSVQMAFLGLLTVTNENNLTLKNNESGDVDISKCLEEPPQERLLPPAPAQISDESDDDEPS